MGECRHAPRNRSVRLRVIPGSGAHGEFDRHLPSELAQLGSDAREQVGKFDLAPGAAGMDGGGQDNVARLAAVQVHEDGELIELGGGELRASDQGAIARGRAARRARAPGNR